ncbi:MAG: hypothetical protein AB1631_01795 [Acidobacteriota bacterium]
MRIKIFHGDLPMGLHTREDQRNQLENQVNQWLASQSNIEIVDIRVAGNTWSEGQNRFFNAMLILLYKETSAS